LKQIGLAITQYTQDYDEKYPYADYWRADGGDEQGWAARVQPYIKSLEVFGCPSDTKALQSADWAGVYISYAGNGYQHGWNGTRTFHGGPIGMSHCDWLEPGGPSQALMNRPSDTIMVFERVGQDTKGDLSTSTTRDIPPNTILTNSMGDGGQAIPDPGRADAAWPYGKNGGVSAHHFDQSNFLFVDGHVKSMRPVATNTGGNNMWNGTRP
jgi:prepilin-type processing-associated H-X9-DG protein